MKEKIRISKLKVGSIGSIKIHIPFIKIGKGKPVVTIISGLHGNEKTGVEITEKLITKLKKQPNKNGSVQIIPFANPLCLATDSREASTDKKDLNRLFPGNPNGTLSERIAYAIYQRVKNSDLLIDLHTFPGINLLITGVLIPVSGEEKAYFKARDSLHLFNPEIIWQLDTLRSDKDKKGSLTESLLVEGKSAFAVELPMIQKISPQQTQKITNGLVSIINKVIENKIKVKKKQIPVVQRKIVTSSSSGLFLPLKSPGEYIRKNAPFGKLISLESLNSEIINSPFNGIVMMISEKNIVRTGDKILAVGEPVKEKKDD